MKCFTCIGHDASVIAVLICFLLPNLESFGTSYGWEPQVDTSKSKKIIKEIEANVSNLFHSDSAKRVKHYLHQQHKFTKGSKDYPFVIKSTNGKSEKVQVKLEANTHLAYEVMGWYPYWESDLYEKLNFSLLSTTAYFDYELDPKDGSAKTLHDWNTSYFIDSAKAGGSKVLLTVTNFGAKDNKQFLNNPKAIKGFVKNILSVIGERGANGICIDFEGIASSEKKAYSSFIKQLSTDLKKSNKDYVIYITIPCVDWEKSFDFKALNPFVDRFVMMAYSYYGSFSKVAGPVSPNSSGKTWEPYNLENSIDNYLKAGIPPQKTLVALGYFGAVWETKGEEKKSEVKAFVGDRTYDYIQTKIKAPVQYDSESQTAWYHYEVSGKESDKYRQCWFDNDSTLGMKMELIKKKGLAGMAIWALGYDKGHPELWTAIVKKMSAPGADTTNSKESETSKEVDATNKGDNTDSGFWNKLSGVEEVLQEMADYKTTIAAIMLFVVLFGGAGVIIAMLMPGNRDFFFGSLGKIILFSVLFVCLLLFLLRLIGFLADMQVAVVIGFVCGVVALYMVYKIVFRIEGNKP